MYCWPCSLTSHILSNLPQSVIYLQSLLMIPIGSHFQNPVTFSPSLLHSTLWLHLCLSHFGLLANGCSQISFLHKDCFFFSFAFSLFHLCQIHPGSILLNPFFHFHSRTSQLCPGFNTSFPPRYRSHLDGPSMPLLPSIAINSICNVLYCLETLLLRSKNFSVSLELHCPPNSASFTLLFRC